MGIDPPVVKVRLSPMPFTIRLAKIRRHDGFKGSADESIGGKIPAA
jgi:hypothetical protein